MEIGDEFSGIDGNGRLDGDGDGKAATLQHGLLIIVSFFLILDFTERIKYIFTGLLRLTNGL